MMPQETPRKRGLFLPIGRNDGALLAELGERVRRLKNKLKAVVGYDRYRTVASSVDADAHSVGEVRSFALASLWILSSGSWKWVHRLFDGRGRRSGESRRRSITSSSGPAESSSSRPRGGARRLPSAAT